MKTYQVTGMTCAACSSRVEKAVEKVDGVTVVSVSLLTNSMQVSGTASDQAIINAVVNAGYGASCQGDRKKTGSQEDSLFSNEETKKLKWRLLLSVILLIPMMYVSMGHMMWHWPLPHAFAENHLAIAIYEMLLAILIMVINQKFYINGFRNLFRGAPNMDTLVALGSSASFGYSLYALFAMTGAVLHADMTGVMHYMDDLYFESAAMIVALITIGKTLESYSKGKTTDALKSLVRLTPKEARVLIDGREESIEIDKMQKDMIFVVRPGERIPVDGLVLEGESAVDESSLTGESIPVDKMAGSYVSASTMNQSGFLTCKASRVGEDTTIAKIIQLVKDASAGKAPIAKIADRVSAVFVPSVLLIAAAVFVIWLLAGQSFSFALARGISVLVISCPCALGLATPVAIMVGNGSAARKGILFKTAASLEETGKAKILVLDKTGTLTYGKPVVTDILPAQDINSRELLTTAFALESKSEHPLAKAITAYAKEQEILCPDTQQFRTVPGNGLSAVLDEKAVYGGNANYINQYCKIPPAFQQETQQLAGQGKTPLFFARDGICLGAICVADQLKDDACQAITELKQMGLRVIMLTGDNANTAATIGERAGLDAVISDVLPDEKELVVRQLKKLGKTIMVGDGINDAPALSRADIGMAIGAGTDVAIDVGDLVLVNSHVSDIARAIRLSRNVLRNIKQNLFWAFIYNIIGIPLAAGAYYYAFGWKLNPMFGAAAMSLSSFCVVMNALRLNLPAVYDKTRSVSEAGKTDVTETINECKELVNKENQNMTKTVEIKGMMCGHCEAHMKKAFEKLDAVSEAVCDHKAGTAVLTLSADLSEDVIKATVEDCDYEYVGIRA